MSFNRIRNVSAAFFFDQKLASTRNADLYRVKEKTASKGYMLWVRRTPMEPEGEAALEFVKRLEQIADFQPRVCSLLDFGVDETGIAYALLPLFTGSPLIDVKKTARGTDSKEADRRFVAAIKVIDRLHQERMFCGDLCESSFFVSPEGEINFIGVMGTLPGEQVEGISYPAKAYIAPEELTSSGTPSFTSDIYSLGVFGFGLFTGEKLSEKTLELHSLKSLLAKSDAPQWITSILNRCLSSIPSNRFSSAGELLSVITEGREKGREGDAFLPSETEQHLRRENPSVITRRPDSQKRNLGRHFMLAAGLGVGACTLGIGYHVTMSIISPPKNIELSEELKTHQEATGSSEMVKVIEGLSENTRPLSEKEKAIEKLTNSADPLMHDVLVKTAKEAATAPERHLAEVGVLKRAESAGLLQASRIVENWLKAQPHDQLPAGYEEALQVLNGDLPDEGRVALLKQLRTKVRDMPLQLLSAIALDQSNKELMRALLETWVSETMGRDNLQELSAVQLISLHPRLWLIFSETILSKVTTLSDAELRTLMLDMAERGDGSISRVAEVYLTRGNLSAYQRTSLQLLKERQDIPYKLLPILARSSIGETLREDLKRFAEWSDPSVDPLLLLSCAQGKEEDIRLEAFDLLAVRPLSSPTAKELFKWVNEKYWSDRKKVVQSVCALSLFGTIEEEEIKSLVLSNPSLGKLEGLLAAVSRSPEKEVVLLLLRNFSDKLSFSSLIGLLKYPEKEMRLRAIQLLKGYNDAMALKVIAQQFDQEKDSEVIEAYKNAFDMLKERT